MTDHAKIVRDVLDHACWRRGTPSPHAALDALVTERDEAVGFTDVMKESLRQYDRGWKAAEAEVARLTAALEHYGWHSLDPVCPAARLKGDGHGPCECGFDAARALLGKDNE